MSTPPRRRKGTTAGELVARLNADPEWRRKRAEEDAAREARAAELRVAEQPLLRDLADAGTRVDSVWDLVNTRDEYPELVPILMSHVTRAYPDTVREGIARALGVPATASYWQQVRKLYIDEPNERVKDGLAVALVACADDDRLEDVIALLRDPSLGTSRVILFRVLERSRSSRAQTALMSLGAHPELGEQAQASLRVRKRRQQRRR
jgi:hypothetical protein